MPEKIYHVQQVRLQMVRERTLEYEGQLPGPAAAAKLAAELIGDADREHLIAVFLDTRKRIAAIHTVSIGTLTSSVTHPREVFKAALLANAYSVLLIHNHPDGDTYPSDQDLETTQRLVKAGEILGIPVLDHLIIGRDGDWRSLAHGGFM